MTIDNNRLTLAQWRRMVAETYAEVRATAETDPAQSAARFRAHREQLFMHHPESPIAAAERPTWRGAAWYPYDPAWRVVGQVALATTTTTFEIRLAADGAVRCTRIGTVEFVIAGASTRLALYWFEGYGGGLWLPFYDATNGETTYGGGRYLYDTIKGADLGASPGKLMLDFNYAYNPSCAYDDRWSCPLSPIENRLNIAVTAGERSPKR